jgi:hypothetical protein
VVCGESLSKDRGVRVVGRPKQDGDGGQEGDEKAEEQAGAVEQKEQPEEERELKEAASF